MFGKRAALVLWVGRGVYQSRGLGCPEWVMLELCLIIGQGVSEFLMKDYSRRKEHHKGQKGCVWQWH